MGQRTFPEAVDHVMGAAKTLLDVPVPRLIEDAGAELQGADYYRVQELLASALPLWRWAQKQKERHDQR